MSFPRNIFAHFPSFLTCIIVATTYLTVSNASQKYLRMTTSNSISGISGGMTRNLQSECRNSCRSDEVVRVIIKTSNKAGKRKAMKCSMSEIALDPQNDFKIETETNGYILGISICAEDRTIIENTNGVTSVEYEQIYIPLQSGCKKDCSVGEIDRVLIQTSNEIGKDNALLCSMSTSSSSSSRSDVEIKMGEGYILGIGVCSNDRTILVNTNGITHVEDDHQVFILDP